MDGSHLMDPEGTGTVPGPTRDTHHSLLVGFETGLEWTVSVHGTVFGSPKLADLDLDGDLDVIIQSADGWVDVLGDDGSSIPGWPVDGGWISGPDVMASPSIVDLTASSTPEILAVHPYGCNAFESSGLPASPWMSNWGGGLVYYPAWSSPVASDLDNNGDFELVLGRQNITLGSNPISLYIRDTDGSLIKYKLWDMEESVTATPSICDVDENGSLEVIAVTDLTEFFPGLDGYGTVYCFNPITGDELWSKYVGGVYITGAISTGKILADETVGVVVGAHTGSNSIKVLNGTTGNLAYSPLATAGGIQAGTSIADVNGDGHLDIVASSVGGYLYCWRGDTGEDNPGFPVNLGAFTDDGVSIGDVDGDGMLELVLAGSDGKLHAINHDGTSTSGFPITVSSCNDLSGQPAIGDIDGDGRLEIVFSEENNSVLHCYEMGDNSAYNYLPWPQFQHDAQNTGYFPTDITPPAEPTSFEGDGELTGDIFTVDLTWTVSVNDPSSTAPQQPTDVVSYRIYRKIPPRPIEQIATLPAGTSAYTDVITFTSFPYPSVVAYFASAWDGVNESDFTPVTKVLTGSLENIALGCPAREIFHSTSIRTSQNLTVACSYFSDRGQINSCRTLTDGEYDAVYSPSSSSNCVEIDLGGMFTINDVVVMGTDQALCETPLYELSRDGRNFSHIDSGRARYVRVYSSAGATEIEVLGLSYQETSTQVEVRRSNSEGYRIVAIEEGSPITATVFDLSGRSVWRGSSSTGEILWNRSNSSGNSVPSGVYLIMVESDDMETVTAKVVVR
ncbi:MAG: T9SS type A sorting domain-containing protein, partial [Candidatus Sabulitectum sp.]|nr:T9SS type A sorting domain-containing protein [Candidatus Sabulitectum sp.]